MDIQANPQTFDVKWSATNIHKCSIWKSDTDKQSLPWGVPPVEEQQRKYNIQSDIKTLLGIDYRSGKDNKLRRLR